MDAPRPNSRRSFLKVAGAAAVSAAAGTAASCSPNADATKSAPNASTSAPRDTGFDRATLDAVANVILPQSIGESNRRDATDAFVAWIDGYEPVAEEMHGYGYSDVRYLPPDPAPAWRAQLEGLDLLADRMRHKRFAQLDDAARIDVLTAALAHVPAGRLPSPLGAPHVAIALLAHWASSPAAWNLALGAEISPNSCRQLQEVETKPRSSRGVTA